MNPFESALVKFAAKITAGVMRHLADGVTKVAHVDTAPVIHIEHLHIHNPPRWRR